MSKRHFAKNFVQLSSLAFLLWAALFAFQSALAQSSDDYQPYTSKQLDLIKEHAHWGLPSKEMVLVRNAYLVRYNEQHRVPEWVAYHITEDYLKTPYREQQFKKFHADPEINNPVKDDDYDGVGYDRGHLVPFKAAGGDRDSDGKYAMKDLNGDGKFNKDDKDPNGKYLTDDADDLDTVKQVNYMSNIAPQHENFNRNGGHWWTLEGWVRKQLERDDIGELWVYAGCVFGQGEIEKIGPDKDITIPAAFYKIVIQKPAVESEPPKVLAFLFPHQRERQGDLDDFLVSIDTIEALIGLDFFSTMGEPQEKELESKGTWKLWEGF